MNLLRRDRLVFAIVALIFVEVLLLYIMRADSPSVSKSSSRTAFQTKPVITPRAEYANPFKKTTQYTNPFSNYKNPFDR